MSLVTIAVSGLQAVLGLVGLVVGGVKVAGQEDQVDEFRRYGYPQWFRIGTGIVEISAGVALLAGIVWVPVLALVGGVLLAGVMGGAILTHLRISDPLSKIAVPTVLLLGTLALIAELYYV